jgi:hypothetical protein
MTDKDRIAVLEAELNFAAVQLKDWYETWVREGKMPLPQEFERTRTLITKTINAG